MPLLHTVRATLTESGPKSGFGRNPLVSGLQAISGISRAIKVACWEISVVFEHADDVRGQMRRGWEIFRKAAQNADLLGWVSQLLTASRIS